MKSVLCKKFEKLIGIASGAVCDAGSEVADKFKGAVNLFDLGGWFLMLYRLFEVKAKPLFVISETFNRPPQDFIWSNEKYNQEKTSCAKSCQQTAAQ